MPFRPLLSPLALVSLLAFPLAVNAADKEDCLDCHNDKTLTKTNAAGRAISLYVNAAWLTNSVHRTNSCRSCHADLSAQHPDDNLPAKPVNCGLCHTNAANQYQTSIHGFSRKLGSSAAAACADCHGHHQMVPVKNADSPVFKMNLPQTCARCHTNESMTAEYKMKYPQVAAHFLDSIHGRALLKMGLIVAPSCNDCHGVHEIKRSVDRSSPINHANIAATCGKCHVKVEQVYNQSVHGQLLAKGGGKGPVCTDCHSAHEIEPPVNGHFKQVSDQRCGKCHQDRLTHYRDTYHGKAMALGKPNTASEVAACYDCHGHHDVLPAANPQSRLSAANIVATCQQCHPKANASFARYQPHANPLDRKHYPLLNAVFLAMTALLVSVFTFFGAHTLLWLLRSAWLYLHDSKEFREAKVHIQKDDEWFIRFQPFERFLHFLVVSSFLLLVVTGMPLKFYYTDWAKALTHVIGGVSVARSLHHFGALITFLYFGLHVCSLALRAWQNRNALRDPATGQWQPKRFWKALFGPDSMVPTLQDWKDFVAHNRWFFGRGEKPQFDRWTYWEKFDYFAVFWGVFIIGASGMILWFPEFCSRFLPGWIINIALVVHSDEALLAAGFIFSIHFFNTHFRLEKFPMDTVIFSGRISKAEMLHERKRWYDRLTANGVLDQFRVKDEWERWKNIVHSFGFFFFGLGVVLLLLIIYAMVARLFH